MKAFRRDTDEHGGVVEMYIFRNDDPNMISGVLQRNRRMLRFVAMINHFFDALNDPRRWPTQQPPQCLTCDYAFKPGELPPAVVIQVPFGAEAREDEEAIAMCSGLCASCSGLSDNEISDKAAAMMQGQVLQEGHA